MRARVRKPKPKPKPNRGGQAGRVDPTEAEAAPGEAQRAWRGDAREIHGRYRGDIGRYTGGTEEI